MRSPCLPQNKNISSEKHLLQEQFILRLTLNPVLALTGSVPNYTDLIELTIIALLSCFAFASNSTLSAFNSSLLFSSLFFSSSFAKTQQLKIIVQKLVLKLNHFFHFFFPLNDN